MLEAIDHRTLYRLPWNLADNPIVWLEPTQACNLACDGCYRKNERSHKSLETIREELETFERLRNYDGVSIAGGDPLCHPEIVEIVREVARRGKKPILNTNGLELTRELLAELRQAGLVGLTFHVDSRQGRPGWRNKTEAQRNELRSELAELVASVGGLAVAFNSTVYEDTLEQVPDVVEWAARNIDKVHTVVFITYRAAVLDAFDDYARGRPVDMAPIVYAASAGRRTDMSSREVVRVIRSRDPQFRPAAYLNGTERPDTLKWLLALRVGDRHGIHGYVGPKLIEVAQTGYHVLRGRYLAYSPPWVLGMGRGLLLGGAWDAGVRRALGRYLVAAARHPRRLLDRQHLQAVMVIQPIDILPDGRQNMCDGCPDITLHDGRLVWSCRLEELRHFGCWVQTVPRAAPRPDVAAA